jgi:hypothetical protein
MFVQPDYAVQTIADLANELQDLDEEVGAVVIDFDMNINFIKLMKAVSHLKNSDCLFVVGGIDVRVPVQSGYSIIGEFQDAIIIQDKCCISHIQIASLLLEGYVHMPVQNDVSVVGECHAAISILGKSCISGSQSVLLLLEESVHTPVQYDISIIGKY